MSSIIIPPEREEAWGRYKKKFGKDYPVYFTHMVYGDDWEEEVADINRRIKGNDPAPDKPLPKDVVF